MNSNDQKIIELREEIATKRAELDKLENTEKQVLLVDKQTELMLIAERRLRHLLSVNK